MTRDISSRIHQAAEALNYTELLRIFREHPQEARAVRAQNGVAPVLFDGVFRNNYLITRIFLEGGVDVNECWIRNAGDWRTTALMEAMGRDIRVVNALLSFKADTSLRDHAGDTALHYAVACCRPDAAKALVAAGCDVNARGQEQETALHRAVRRLSGEMTECLLDLGARRDIRDGWEKTAHERAIYAASQGLGGPLDAFNRAAVKIGRAGVAGASKMLHSVPKPALRGRTT